MVGSSVIPMMDMGIWYVSGTTIMGMLIPTMYRPMRAAI